MICSSEQLRRLLEMNVLFGPVTLAVENVNQDNIVHSKTMLINHVEEAEPDMVCSWVNSFESMDFEVGVVVEILEVNTVDKLALRNRDMLWNS